MTALFSDEKIRCVGHVMSGLGACHYTGGKRNIIKIKVEMGFAKKVFGLFTTHVGLERQYISMLGNILKDQRYIFKKSRTSFFYRFFFSSQSRVKFGLQE